MGEYFNNELIEKLNKPCYISRYVKEDDIIGKLKKTILNDLLVIYKGQLRNNAHLFTVKYPGGYEEAYIIGKD